MCPRRDMHASTAASMWVVETGREPPVDFGKAKKKGEWHLQNHVDIVGKRVHKGQKGEAQEGDSNCVDRGGGRGILAPDPHGLTQAARTADANRVRLRLLAPDRKFYFRHHYRSCRFSNFFARGGLTQGVSTASIAASQATKGGENHPADERSLFSASQRRGRQRECADPRCRSRACCQGCRVVGLHPRSVLQANSAVEFGGRDTHGGIGGCQRP